MSTDQTKHDGSPRSAEVADLETAREARHARLQAIHSEVAGPGDDASAGSLSPEQAEQDRARRDARLHAIHHEVATRRVSEDGLDSEGQKLNEFLGQMLKKKQDRRYQLGIIQEFFENPVKFDVQIDYIPSSTPIDEIRVRQKELAYRINLLDSVLSALRGEMEMLNQAAASHEQDDQESREA